jgi:hypothetical protein
MAPGHGAVGSAMAVDSEAGLAATATANMAPRAPVVDEDPVQLRRLALARQWQRFGTWSDAHGREEEDAVEDAVSEATTTE